jgi:hypothetical protein
MNRNLVGSMYTRSSIKKTKSQRHYLWLKQSILLFSLFTDGVNLYLQLDLVLFRHQISDFGLHTSKFRRCLPSFGSFLWDISEEKIKKKIHQKQELPPSGMFVNRLEQIEQSCGSFGQTVSEETRSSIKKTKSQRHYLWLRQSILLFSLFTDGVNLYLQLDLTCGSKVLTFVRKLTLSLHEGLDSPTSYRT